jgi:uncharacterized protein YuzE
MKITYDPEADALYIELRRVQAFDSVDIEEGVTADLDAEGHIIGLEVLDASERLSPAELKTVEFTDYSVGTRPLRRQMRTTRRVKAR